MVISPFIQGYYGRSLYLTPIAKKVIKNETYRHLL